MRSVKFDRSLTNKNVPRLIRFQGSVYCGCATLDIANSCLRNTHLCNRRGNSAQSFPISLSALSLFLTPGFVFATRVLGRPHEDRGRFSTNRCRRQSFQASRYHVSSDEDSLAREIEWLSTVSVYLPTRTPVLCLLQSRRSVVSLSKYIYQWLPRLHYRKPCTPLIEALPTEAPTCRNHLYYP